MMASGSSSKRPAPPRLPSTGSRKGLPWLTIAAVVVVLLLAGGITWVVVDKSSARSAQTEALAAWQPSVENRDPSVNIPGIFVGARTDKGADSAYAYSKYVAAIHVSSDQRVAYDRFPPVGGPHDAQWADCQGVVYDVPVRDENMVHTLEHGAIWIAYNPDAISGAALDTLKAFVTGQNYITLTPYPGLTQNISLQAWAHQLQVSSADDPRIGQFITALRQNQWVYPETGARCDSPGWDSANPPAFDASPRTSADVQMDGKGAAGTVDESGMGVTAEPSSGSSASGSEPSGSQSSGVESSGAQSSGAESSAVESSGAESSGAESSGAESSGAESSGAESSGASSAPASSSAAASTASSSG